MWDVRVCVACLATDVRMYSMSASSLLQPYQLLAGVQLDSLNDYMPRKLCWECAALVNKFNLFRHKCERAYLLLQDIYNQHDEITEQHVKEIEREQRHLCSSYSITHISEHTLDGRNVKITKDTFKQEFEIQIVKEEHDLVKYEPELHFDEPSANSDNEEVESDWKNVQEPDQEESSLGDLNVKEAVKEVSVQELGWTEIALTQEQANDFYLLRKRSTKYRKSKYKCVLCYHGFQDKRCYENHMSRHGPHTGPYECDICKMRFTRREIILRHIYMNHTMKYHCKVCNNDYFSRSVAKHHLELHSKFGLVLKSGTKRQKKLTPKLKLNDFEDRFEVVEHIQTQEQMMEVIRDRQFTKGYKTAPFKCSLCYKVFLEEKTYKNHMLQHDPASGEFECDVCKVRLETHYKLYHHISKMHSRSYRCKICSDICYTRNTAQDHHQRHKGVKHICHVCGATFSRDTALANHMHMKHPSVTANHICAECGASFPAVNGLRVHKLIRHRVETVPEENAPYCEHCKVQFTSAQAWTQHNAHCKNPDNVKEDIGNTAQVYDQRRRGGEHICPTCGAGFSRTRALAKHVHRKHPSLTTSHICAECGASFPAANGLRIHKRVMHQVEMVPEENPPYCEHCKVQFTSAQAWTQHNAHCESHANVKEDIGNTAQVHHQRHKGGKHICPTCGAGFCRNRALAHHVHVKHPSLTTSYICAECGASFPAVNGLRTHNFIMHRVETVPEENAPYCEHCKVQFKSAQAWTQHNAHCESHANVMEDIGRNSALANHVHRKHASLAASHICADCGASFPAANGLRTHNFIMHRVETVPEENAPYCEHCKVQFKSAQAWTQHKAHCKSPDKVKERIVLDVTEKVVWSGKRHRDTLKTLWTGPQPCVMCGETMEGRRQYFWHFRRAHPGEPYPLRTVSTHVCDQCGKAFQCAALLRLHEPVHTGMRSYRCDVCAKAFLTPVALRTHTITHSDVRPHKCDLCAKTFKFKKSLKRHTIVHTGEKPYSCEVCAQAFTTRSWLQIHVRKVHNKEHIPTKPRIRKRKPV